MASSSSVSLLSPPSVSVAGKHLLADSTPPKKKKQQKRKKKDPGFRNKYPRKPFRISHMEHKTNDWARSKINFLVGQQEPLLATLKRRKPTWITQTPRPPVRNHRSVHLRGWATPCSAEEKLDGQHQRVGFLPKSELLARAFCRKDWKRISAESSVKSSHPSSEEPIGQRTEMN